MAEPKLAAIGRTSLIVMVLAGMGTSCSRFGYDAVFVRDGGQIFDTGARDDADGGKDGWLDGGSSAQDAAGNGDGGTSADASGQPDDGPSCATSRVAQIDVEGTKVVGGPHSDFPLLVAVSADWLKTTARGGGVADPQGRDIRFAADIEAVNRLDHELESYDGSSGELVAWVRMPALGASTTLYMRYGCNVGSSLPTSVWSADYAAVWHMQDDHDSTANGNDCTSNAQVIQNQQAKIGAGRTFDGADAKMTALPDLSMDDLFRTGASVSLWMSPRSSGEHVEGMAISKIAPQGPPPTNWREYGWSIVTGPTSADVGSVGMSSVDFRYSYASRSGQWRSTASGWQANVWVFVTVTFARDGAGALIYLDGEDATSVTPLFNPSGSSDPELDHPLVIGNASDSDHSFDGSIDEVRLVRATRTAEWIRTEYNNQSDPVNFCRVTPL